MTDIIVTVPKDYDFDDKLASPLNYWRLARWPSDTEPGDHIYFTQDGEVRWRAIISDVQGGEEGEMDFENLEELPKPRQVWFSFRGYRYYNPEEVSQ